MQVVNRFSAMNTCTQCGNHFSNRGNLVRHLKNLHSNRRLVSFGRPHPYQRKSDEDSNTEEESSSSSQLGSGSPRQKKIFRDEIGKREVETEMADDDQDVSDLKARRKLDMFDEDDDDEDSSADSDDSGEKYEYGDSENSSEDSDDCESSSEDSGGSEDEGVTDEQPEGDAQGEDTVDDDFESSQQSQSKYTNFGRWKDDSGLYVAWKSRSRNPYVAQHREWLKKILETPKSLKPMIKEASDSQLETFREIAFNILNGGVAMPTNSYKGLKKRMAWIRLLGSEESSYEDLRRALLKGPDGAVFLLVSNTTPTCIKSPKAVFEKKS